MDLDIGRSTDMAHLGLILSAMEDLVMDIPVIIIPPTISIKFLVRMQHLSAQEELYLHFIFGSDFRVWMTIPPDCISIF